jgi:heme A synthase
VEEAMISLLISLLIFLIVFALIWWILSVLPLPPPIRQIANVIFVVICALVLIFYFLLPLAGTGSHLGWR